MAEYGFDAIARGREEALEGSPEIVAVDFAGHTVHLTAEDAERARELDAELAAALDKRAVRWPAAICAVLAVAVLYPLGRLVHWLSGCRKPEREGSDA